MKEHDNELVQMNVRFTVGQLVKMDKRMKEEGFRERAVFLRKIVSNYLDSRELRKVARNER